MSSFAAGLERIKGDLTRAVPPTLIRRLADAAGLVTRDRVPPPVVTTHLALTRALHGGTAITHLRHLSGVSFTPSAYCQAIGRLPEVYFHLLQVAVTGRVRGDRPADRWHGHRLFLADGSGVSMPDTPDLQAAFGQPTNQAPGCGFPVAHVLALFELRTGYLLKTITSPLYTHDLAHAGRLHPELRDGDVLVADRAFAPFAHLAACRRRGIHAVTRAHQSRREHRRATRATDRQVVYPRPRWRPEIAGIYDTLPEQLVVREVRVRVRTPGRRVRQLVLVTTLLDRRRYPAREVARVYERRWQVEVDLRSLKTTLGMDVLRSKTAAGVRKEVLAFAIAYNLVVRVVVAAADRQAVPVDRISFVDAVRWLRVARPGEEVPVLVVHPARPGRFEPRVKKRRPKGYLRMSRPRAVLKQELRQGVAA